MDGQLIIRPQIQGRGGGQRAASSGWSGLHRGRRGDHILEEEREIIVFDIQG
jgi:hypothetical protein